VDDPEIALPYTIVLDTINFGSGYFPHLKKPPGLSGYFTVALKLKEHFAAHGPPTASDLRAFTPADMGAIFGQDMSTPAGELMALFSTALNQLGQLLEERFGGSFRALVDAGEGSAEKMAEILVQVPFFDDFRMYDGRKVREHVGRLKAQIYFCKRAQILPWDVHLALRDKSPFGDVDKLTIFADNLVPHVLFVDGVLKYTAELRQRIDNDELIEVGCEEEVEMRAAALTAVEKLREVIRARGGALTSTDIDCWLWNRGHEGRYKEVKRHRTRTVHY
jgi:hypothetical protein